MANQARKLGDFNSAYAKAHGHPPKSPRRQEHEVQAETIVKSIGGKPTNIVARMDLEKCARYEFLLEIESGDTMVAKAGGGILQLTFTHLDGSGRLVAMAYSNGGYQYEHTIFPREKVRVWSGMLMDYSGFVISAERLALRDNRSNLIACVRLNAVTGISLGSFSIDPA
jgi:hypothetical protein